LVFFQRFSSTDDIAAVAGSSLNDGIDPDSELRSLVGLDGNRIWNIHYFPGKIKPAGAR
jgi:hypothetical protein